MSSFWAGPKWRTEVLHILDTMPEPEEALKGISLRMANKLDLFNREAGYALNNIQDVVVQMNPGPQREYLSEQLRQVQRATGGVNE